jgi:hypothetical protein
MYSTADISAIEFPFGTSGEVVFFGAMILLLPERRLRQNISHEVVDDRGFCSSFTSVAGFFLGVRTLTSNGTILGT